MLRSLRTKSIVFSILLALVPVLILSLALLGISYDARRNDVLARQQEQAKQLAGQVGSTVDEIEQALDVFARTSDWESLEPSDQRLLIRTLHGYRTRGVEEGGLGVFDEVLLLDREGQPIAGHTTARVMSLDAWAGEARAVAYDTVMAGEAYRGHVYISPATVPTLDLAVPTTDLPGRITGMLWGGIDLDDALWPLIAGPGIPEGMFVYIFDDQGYLVLRNDGHSIQRDQPLSNLLAVRQVRVGAQQGVSTYQGLAAERAVGAWEPVEGTDWTLVVETPESLALADVRKLLLPAVLLTLLTLGVAAGAGVLVSRFLMRPVEQLRAGAEIIGHGNLRHRIQVTSQDEIGSLARAFNQMAANLQDSRQQLERWGQEMEDRVEERTRELAAASHLMERRATQLQASAEVARAITSVRDLDLLLPRVVELIGEWFGWYHVGIFLLDGAGKYAVLRAASSEGGRQMLARGHRLRVGEAGIVGFVTGTGQPRIALDVGQDAVYFDSPELHGTRSEMALPLQIGGQIIGALDVQSTEAAAYDDEDVSLMTTLADQVAIAIENARRFAQAQQALEEVQRLHRQYVEREWAKTISRAEELSYEYRRDGVPSSDETPPEMRMALAEGRIGAESGHPGASSGNGSGREPDRAALAAPIKYRDQVIGVLDLEESDPARQWTEDEIALVRAVGDQLGLALENARLFSDAQRRAEQMATLNRIGLDLAAGLEMERVLESLYEQCRQVLATDTFCVALYDASTGIISFPLLTGRDGPTELAPVSIDEQAGLTGHILRSGQLLHIADTHATPQDTVDHPRLIGDLTNRSYIGAPLTARGEVFGVLSIQSLQPNAYTDEDVELLATIAAQAAIAIENARAYERLVETAEQLREVDRLKTQFLANMSHELRTPLNSIIGFSRVLLKGIDGPLNELQETDLGSIFNSGQHLLSLINSILDMSKIEAGKLDFTFEEMDLKDVFKTVISTTTALIKDRPITLRTDVPDDLPTVWADAQRVRQVLLNLMSNAAKFTEEGHILLKAETGQEFVTISVADTGIGIEPEAQRRLFIPFQQVDASTTRRAGGTGLGLAICRSFVEMQGGAIWVDSQPGQGSTFFFTLPIYEFAIENAEAESAVALDPTRKLVLAVDDDIGVVNLLKRYLESDGYQVIGVHESLKALETARRLSSDLSAITLDVVMPNMDGWQVLRALKDDTQTKGIPVILVSIAEGLEQGLSLGATACLRKPTTRDELLETLAKVG